MLAEQHVFSSTGGGRTLLMDVCPKVLQCVEQYSLDSSPLVCVTTDGAPAMMGRRRAPLRCWCVTVRPSDTRCTASFTKRLCARACQPGWRHVCCCKGRQLHPLPQLESPPVSGTGWRGRRAVRRFALNTFAKFAGWVEEHCCPVYATWSPPFFFKRIFPTLTSSSTRYGSLAQPC